MVGEDPGFRGSTSFLSDLAAAGTVMLEQWPLTLWSLMIGFGVELPLFLQRSTGQSSWSILLIPFELIYCGWVGTQRVWFARAFRGDETTTRKAVEVTRDLFGPFASLTIYVLVPVGLVGILLRNLHGGLIFQIVLFFLLDVALTFVTPALALTTRSPGVAMRNGVEILRLHWRSCAPYALVAPLAAIALLRFVPRADLSAGAVFGLAMTSYLCSLICKGATVAYYGRLPLGER